MQLHEPSIGRLKGDFGEKIAEAFKMLLQGAKNFGSDTLSINLHFHRDGDPTKEGDRYPVITLSLDRPAIELTDYEEG